MIGDGERAEGFPPSTTGLLVTEMGWDTVPVLVEPWLGAAKMGWRGGGAEQTAKSLALWWNVRCFFRLGLLPGLAGEARGLAPRAGRM